MRRADKPAGKLADQPVNCNPMEANSPYVTWPQMTAELNRIQASEALARQATQETVNELAVTVRDFAQISKEERLQRKEKAQRREKIFNRFWALCVVAVAAVLAVATPAAVHAIFGVVGV